MTVFCKSSSSPSGTAGKSIAEMNSSIRNPKSEIRNRAGRWFLVQIKEIVDFEEELAGAKN